MSNTFILVAQKVGHFCPDPLIFVKGKFVQNERIGASYLLVTCDPISNCRLFVLSITKMSHRQHFALFGDPFLKFGDPSKSLDP